MKNLSIKTKLFLVVVFPVMAIIFLATDFVHNKLEDVNYLNKFENFLLISKQSSALIVNLQKERSLSIRYVNNISDKEKLDKQRESVDLSYSLLLQKDMLIKQHIKDFREDIDRKSINSITIINNYSNLIQLIIQKISKLLSFNNNIQLQNKIYTYIYFLKAKENLSLQRVISTDIFMSKKYTTNLFVKLNQVHNSFKYNINIFKTSINQDLLRYYLDININNNLEILNYQNLIFDKIHKNEILSHIKDIAGYGGLIHNFKNYLLRGEEKYKTTFLQKYIILENLIEKYKQYKTTKEELEYINNIYNTFAQYKINIDKIDTKSDISLLDKKVKIDDSDAIKALNTLSSSVVGIDIKKWCNLINKNIQKLNVIDNKIMDNILDIQNNLKNQYISNLIMSITIAIILIFIVMFFLIFISKDILCKLKKLEIGLISFFKYVSHDSKRFKSIKIEGSDEFANMSLILNDGIKETVKYIQKELKYHLMQEKQMIQQSRHAAMGEMMRAIIHQWKQPLNAISISNSSINFQIEYGKIDNKFLKKQTANIDKQIQNMSNTMNDFRDFFKPQDMQRFNVSDSINQVYMMVERIFTVNNININLELEKDLYTKGFSNELNQVLINIFNNARDIIKETNCEINDIFVKSYKEDDKVCISITDCAGGVPLSIIDKIFDPYVTTKTDDKGTGIGLDMSKTIIKKVNGKLSVQNVVTKIDNKEYRGASFIIKLNSDNEE